MTYTTPEAIIADTLGGQLAGLALAYPIAWPNQKFTPPADGSTYLRVYDLRNKTGNPFVGTKGRNLQQGIYQVTISAPTDGGTPALLEAAGLVANGFNQGLRLPITILTTGLGASLSLDFAANAYGAVLPAVIDGHVFITKRPDVTTLKSPDGSRFEAPVSISWRAYV